jgi:outer membrane murein-binding lipoprotein Lpp
VSTDGRAPFNPTWITAAAVVVTGILSGTVSGAVTSERVERLSVRMDAAEARDATIERRLADDKLATREALVGLQKDMDRANKTLDGLDQALRVAGFSNLKVSSSPTP